MSKMLVLNDEELKRLVTCLQSNSHALQIQSADIHSDIIDIVEETIELNTKLILYLKLKLEEK